MRLINAFFKWIALLAVALSAGLLIIIFLSGNPQVSAFLLRILILLCVAFMGGFCGRLFFHALPALTLILITLAANLLGMLVIDHFYHSPYQFAFISSSRLLPRTPAIGEISQMIFLLLVSLIPLLLFRFRPARKKQPPRNRQVMLPNFSATWRQTTRKIHNGLISIHPKNWPVWEELQQKRKRKLAKTSARPAVQIRSNSTGQQVIKVNSHKVTTKVSKPTNKKSRSPRLKIPRRLLGKPARDVRLVGEEEHVCPYCLEEVIKSDNRGVRICPECGTWHHQDCWSLTGACGVAHRNELAIN